MLVGTSENNIPFYVKQGFDKYENKNLNRDYKNKFKIKDEKAKEERKKKKKYCGCVFSEEDRYVKKKKDALSLPEGFEWKLKSKEK